MSLESEFFEHSLFNSSKALKYGFIMEGNSFVYSTFFLDDAFQAIISVDNYIVSGKVIEVDLEEEYMNFRIDSFKGEFVYKVREAYFEILHDMKRNCFDDEVFTSNQFLRLCEYIESKYDVVYDNPFSEDGICVFRNRKNQKWFGIAMKLKGKRFNRDGEIEVMNVKLDPSHISSLLNESNFYPAYHMDKKNWISFVLDDSIKDSILFSCIDESYSLVNSKQFWIVPANPKYYDVFSHFENNEEITWKQSTKIDVEDIVYIYITKPYCCILYKCVVIEKDIPYFYNDDNLSMKKIMKLKLIQKFDPNDIPMDSLSKLGIPNIRCTRKVDRKIVQLFDK